MNFVEQLLQYGEDKNVHLIKLLQKYSYNNINFHYFFEGFEDQSFYINFINNKIKYQSEKYICNGKSNVYEVYQLLDWSRFNKARILFFVDKDFSCILNETWPKDHNIFVTNFYSVENYISNEEILERVIRELYHFNESEVIEAILSSFKSCYSTFIYSFKIYLGWILYVRANGIKANLNGIDLNKFFKIDNNLNFLVKKIRNRHLYLSRVTQAAIPSKTWSEVKYWSYAVTSTEEPKVVLRGKFDAWFFTQFIKSAEKHLISLGHKPKTATNINISNFIEVLGPRVSLPSELNDFLDYNLNQLTID